MIRDTFLLLQLYWKIDRRADGGTQRRTQVAYVIGALFLIFMSGSVGIFAAALADGSSLIQINAEILPGLLLTVVLFGVVFVGFNQSLQALYLSDDLDKLLVAPIRTQAVMTAKLLSRLPTTVGLLLVATIPAMLTFGFGLGLGVAYYFLGVVLILVTPLFGISLGALIAIFMVRLLPARRLNEWVGAASIVIGLILSILVYLPSLLGNNEDTFDPQTLAAVETFVNEFGDLPLPSVWVGAALVEFGRGQIIASAFSSLGFYLLITVGFFLVTILLANRLYLSGWLRMQSSGTSREDISQRPGLFGRTSLNFILSFKDWILRVRDPRQLATVVTSIVLAIFFLFFIIRPQDDGSSIFSAEPTAAGQLDILSPGVIVSGLAYFVGWMAFSGLALTTLSIERDSFYILKTAPISASQLFRAKTFSILVPYVLLVSIGLLIGLWVFSYSLLWTPYAWLILVIMGYGLFSYLVSLSFLYPNLDWDDPRRMRNRKAGLPSLIGSAVYTIIAVIVAVATYALAHGNVYLAIPIVIMGLALLAGGTWFFVHWCTTRVEKAWPLIGTEV